LREERSVIPHIAQVERPAVDSTTGLFSVLEDPDQEDDDEDDQENCPQTDVHRYLLSVAWVFPRSWKPKP
jgi:hypothetical protein